MQILSVNIVPERKMNYYYCFLKYYFFSVYGIFLCMDIIVISTHKIFSASDFVCKKTAAESSRYGDGNA